MGTRRITDLQNHPEPFVTTSDLADYWRVSRKQIYKQIEAGTLKAIRLGPRLLRISTSEAIRFEETAKMAPPRERDSSGKRRKNEGVDSAADRRSSSPEPRRS